MRDKGEDVAGDGNLAGAFVESALNVQEIEATIDAADRDAGRNECAFLGSIAPEETGPSLKTSSN